MSTPNNGTYYVRRDVGQPDSRTAGITNKVIEAGVQTSYVHSSKIMSYMCALHITGFRCLQMFRERPACVDSCLFEACTRDRKLNAHFVIFNRTGRAASTPHCFRMKLAFQSYPDPVDRGTQWINHGCVTSPDVANRIINAPI